VGAPGNGLPRVFESANAGSNLRKSAQECRFLLKVIFTSAPNDHRLGCVGRCNGRLEASKLQQVAENHSGELAGFFERNPILTGTDFGDLR